jgi:hypothetical protein
MVSSWKESTQNGSNWQNSEDQYAIRTIQDLLNNMNSTKYDIVGIRILQLRRLARNEQEPNVPCNVDTFVVLPSGPPDVHHSQKFRLLQ